MPASSSPPTRRNAPAVARRAPLWPYALVGSLALGVGVAGFRFARPSTMNPDRGTPVAGVPELRSGTLLPTPRPLPATSLVGMDGKALPLAALAGRWTVVFPGYTSCPDICPTTLVTLKAALKQLGPSAGRVRIMLLSVDPERDTPEKLKSYVTYFDPGFTAATLPAPALAELAGQLGFSYLKVESPQGSGYTMDHSSALILLDPRVRLAGYLTPDPVFHAGTLAADLSTVLSQADAPPQPSPPP